MIQILCCGKFIEKQDNEVKSTIMKLVYFTCTVCNSKIEVYAMNEVKSHAKKVKTTDKNHRYNMARIFFDAFGY